MTETYTLTDTENGMLPSIPVPHDCVIASISEEDDCLCFRFEEKDLAGHEAIERFCPGAKALIMRFHMDARDRPVFQLLEQKNRRDDAAYEVKKYKKLFKLAEPRKKLTYLNHYVACGQIIITMVSDNASIQLCVSTDTVTLEWTEP